MRNTVLFTLFFACITLSHQSYAGILDDFESAKEEESKNPSSNNQHENQHGNRHGNQSNRNDDDFAEFVFELMFRGLWYSAAYGGNTSAERYGFARREKHIEKRKIGEPLIPNFRFDFHYQKGENTITSADFRFEYGLGQFAGQARTTVMTEGDDEDSLRLNQAHYLYRMSFGNHFSFNAGIGVSQLIGNSRKTALSFTFPVYYHPNDFIGFEIKTGTHLFNNAKILDLDYSVLFTKNLFSVTFGYRELVKSGVDITGPYAGFSMHY